MTENQLATIAVDIAFTVHKELGPGLLESVYEAAFCYELDLLKIAYTRQETIAINYKTIKLDHGFRADIIIEDTLLIEIKSIESIERIHHKTTLNYLKLKKYKLGFLINFNVELIKNGIHRKVNGLEED